MDFLVSFRFRVVVNMCKLNELVLTFLYFGPNDTKSKSAFRNHSKFLKVAPAAGLQFPHTRPLRYLYPFKSVSDLPI